MENNLQKTKIFITTYGAPVASSSLQYGNRFRAFGDVISMFDNGAITKMPIQINPHSYDNGFQQVNKTSITE